MELWNYGEKQVVNLIFSIPHPLWRLLENHFRWRRHAEQESKSGCLEIGHFCSWNFSCLQRESTMEMYMKWVEEEVCPSLWPVVCVHVSSSISSLCSTPTITDETEADAHAAVFTWRHTWTQVGSPIEIWMCRPWPRSNDDRQKNPEGRYSDKMCTRMDEQVLFTAPVSHSAQMTSLDMKTSCSTANVDLWSKDKNLQLWLYLLPLQQRSVCPGELWLFVDL